MVKILTAVGTHKFPNGPKNRNNKDKLRKSNLMINMNFWLNEDQTQN